MRRLAALLNSENHTGEDIGDISPILRADFEDALIQALDDTLIDGRLNAFRSFLERFRIEFPPDIYELLTSQDSWGWYAVHFFTCMLRRMQPRWEHSANKLMHEFNVDPSQIPKGFDFLHL